MMTERKKPFPIRFYAMLMIGVGFIALGVMLFLLLSGSAPLPAEDEFSTVPVMVDYAAPELNLVDMAGNNVSLRDYTGSVVLVNLWATWCPPCKEEMPALQSFYEKHRSEGFALIGINQEETLEIVKPFVADFGLTFPVWLDENYMAQRMFNTMSLPSSFVIDRNGTVRLMWVGAVSDKFLEKYVTKIIKE
ncbi:glutathione peroxidase [Anaerolineales bacterium]|nr:glutathione peroxidase [Anaerolineales bacterium]